MLPLTYFADRRFSVGSGVITTSFFILFGWFFLFSLYLQFARGYSPLEAGLATLPSPRRSSSSRRGARRSPNASAPGRTMAYGFALVALGMAVMGGVSVDSPYLLLAIGMVLMSAGMAVTAAPATGNILNAVPLNRAGVGLRRQRHDTRARRGARHRRVREHRQLGVPLEHRPRRSRAPGRRPQPRPRSRSAPRSGSATQVGGADGAAIIDRAASAFTDAFNVASMVSVAIAVVSAAVVASVVHPDQGADGHRDLRCAAEVVPGRPPAAAE